MCKQVGGQPETRITHESKVVESFEPQISLGPPGPKSGTALLSEIHGMYPRLSSLLDPLLQNALSVHVLDILGLEPCHVNSCQATTLNPY